VSTTAALPVWLRPNARDTAATAASSASVGDCWPVFQMSRAARVLSLLLWSDVLPLVVMLPAR
jgi:hypothetical protein